jgi:hypothetical protein
MAVVLEKGHGKDGSDSFPYVRAHPTNYNWREDIEQLTHSIVNRASFSGRIWINTYHHHPPGPPDDFWRWRDTTSFDVWGFDGRGDPLPKELGGRVFHVLFNDPARGHLVDNLAGQNAEPLPDSAGSACAWGGRRLGPTALPPHTRNVPRQGRPAVGGGDIKRYGGAPREATRELQ